MTEAAQAQPSSDGRPSLSRLATIIAPAAAMMFLAGFALAGPFSVGNLTEAGSGTSTATQPLLWWHLRFVDRVAIPSPVPAPANGTVSAPQLLPLTPGAFSVNPTTAGHAAVRLAFNETTGAIPTTEFELAVTVTNATTGTNATWVVFFETQAHYLAAGIGFSLYVDVGTVSAPLAGVLYVAETCGPVGTCP